MTLVPDWKPGWVEIMAPAVDLAERIYRTEFVASGLRGSPEKVVACILAGHEVGIGPMQSLSKIYVVDGKPTMAAELMRALVLRAGHDIWVEESSNTRVTVCGRRAGREFVSKVTWTMDDARQAKLAGKQNWQQYPRAMLLARATSELARLMFADVLGGISYSIEELEDSPGDTPPGAPEPAQATTTHTRKARARKALPTPTEPAEPAAAPPLPGETGYDTPEALVQRAQVVATKARRAGLDRQAVVEAATFGQKTSAKELTAEEAADALRLIDELPPSPDPANPTRAELVVALKARVAALRGPGIQALHTFMDEVGIGSERKAQDLTLDELLVVEAFLDQQDMER